MQTRSRQTTAGRSRVSRGRVSYRESSSDDDTAESPDELFVESIRPKTAAVESRRQPPTNPRLKKWKSSKKISSTHPFNGKIKSQHNSGSNNISTPHPFYTSKTSPPWSTLPYEILLQIFQYAYYPLCDNYFQPTPSIKELLRSALVCKSFAEPALSALYYMPPLSPPNRAQGLLTALARQTSNSSFNYRSKVKYLEIEVASILLNKYGGAEPIKLEELIAFTPQLRGIEMRFLADAPHLRTFYNLGRMRTGGPYKIEIFDKLESSRVRLLTWKWNFELNRSAKGRCYPWSTVKTIHQQASFQSLRDLSIQNYDGKQPIKESDLGDAVSVLPNLKTLKVYSCLLSESLLDMLPWNLECFHITSCLNVTSEILQPFLLTHGGNIRELILDHNQCLNLAFLVSLAIACPVLKIFKMDMTFHSPFTTFIDSEPKFGALLLPGVTPTWPTTLQTIELLHLRKWYPDTAEIFLNSLVDSAADLLQLRRLLLKASIEIGWRDRANFRDRWIGRLKRVFLRKKSSPSMAHGSRAIHLEKDIAKSSDTDILGGNTNSKRPGLRHGRIRRLSHVEIPQDVLEYSESDSDAPIVPARRSKRLREQDNCENDYDGRGDRRRIHSTDMQPPQSAQSGHSSDGTFKSKKSENEEDGTEYFIQGMCDVVDIRIDNLRPAEKQFSETDFLDAEPSGDEDWNGDDADPGDGGYAW